MNRALRGRHGRMIVVITALVAVLFAAAIALRPDPVPTTTAPVLDDSSGGSRPMGAEPNSAEGGSDGS